MISQPVSVSKLLSDGVDEEVEADDANGLVADLEVAEVFVAGDSDS